MLYMLYMLVQFPMSPTKRKSIPVTTYFGGRLLHKFHKSAAVFKIKFANEWLFKSSHCVEISTLVQKGFEHVKIRSTSDILLFKYRDFSNQHSNSRNSIKQLPPRTPQTLLYICIHSQRRGCNAKDILKVQFKSSKGDKTLQATNVQYYPRSVFQTTGIRFLNFLPF